MAKQSIDPAKLYQVELAKSVKVGRMVINPSNGTRLKGDALEAVLAQDATAVLNFRAV